MTTPPSLHALNFDVTARIQTLRDCISRVLDTTQPTYAHYAVADIGGHPAHLAGSLTVPALTFDLPRRGPTGYVRASGAGLPLRDKSIPVVVAGDTLEHIPPQYREGFVSELARCASEAVIFSGPWNTPGVAEAEAAVRSVMPQSSPTWRWLDEHERFGVPDLHATVATLENMGFTLSIQPDGDLWEWFLLFLTENTLHGLPGFSADWHRWQPEWNALSGGEEAPGLRPPTYRHVLVASRKPVAIFPLFDPFLPLPSGFFERISAATSLAQMIQHNLRKMSCNADRSNAEYERLRKRMTAPNEPCKSSEPQSFLKAWFR